MSRTFVLKNVGGDSEGANSVYDIVGNRLGVITHWNLTSTERYDGYRNIDGGWTELNNPTRILTMECKFGFIHHPQGEYDPLSPVHGFLFNKDIPQIVHPMRPYTSRRIVV